MSAPPTNWPVPTSDGEAAMSRDSSPPLSGAALTAFVLALLSLLFQALTAIPALFLGLRGLRAVNASDGRVRGRPLAVAALGLAALIILLDALGLFWLILLSFHEANSRVECTNR